MNLRRLSPRDYKIIDDGIWIPRAELERLRDLYQRIGSATPFRRSMPRKAAEIYGDLANLIYKR